MRVYLKNIDQPKENKVQYKTLDLAWIHTDNQKILDELYVEGFIYFDTIGKKSNLEGFEFTKRNWDKIFFDKGWKYYEFFLSLCLKFIFVTYSDDIGYFDSIVGEHLNSKNNLCIKLKIKNYPSRDKGFVFYEITLLKKDFDLHNFKIGDEIPIMRDVENNAYVKVNYDKLDLMLKEKIKNKVINFGDYGIIIDIKIEFNNFFKKDFTTIYYSYNNTQTLKLAILSKDKYNLCKDKLIIGTKIFLKLTQSGFKTWDWDKQLEYYNETKIIENYNLERPVQISSSNLQDYIDSAEK